MKLKCPKTYKIRFGNNKTILQYITKNQCVFLCWFFFFFKCVTQKKQEMRVSRYNQHKITFNVSDFLFNFLFIYFKPGNFS